MTRAKIFFSYIAAALASGLVSASCASPEPSEPGSGEPAAPSHAPSVAKFANKDPELSSSKVEPSAEPTLQCQVPNDVPQPKRRSPPILEAEPNSKGARMGKPLFSCGYVNFAWGSTAFGYILDDQGRIWFYDLGKTWSPQPAGDRLTRETGLRERFRNPVLQSLRVPPAQLAAMRKQAEVARGGRIEKKHVMYDAGSAGCEAYLWETSDTYREVELGSSGDFEIRSSSLEADHLREWLRDDLGMATHLQSRRK